MSMRHGSRTPKKFEMPDTFSFGLEERPETLDAIKLETEDSDDCQHNWHIREKTFQTLRHEGKTIVECHTCKRTAAVFDWKLEQARKS